MQREMAERLSHDHGNGIVQEIASQTLQIDDIPIASVPAVLHALAQAGFAPPGDRDDPMLHVAPCVRAGACPRERFDVTPYAVATAVYSRQTGRPRLRIAFSGCPSDCALASVADLGFLAQCQEGIKGFCVYAGGTPEPDPALGVKIETFIDEDEIFAVVEAMTRLLAQQSGSAEGPVLRVHDIVDRLGPVEFTRRYREQRATVTQAQGDDAVFTLTASR